MNALDWDEDEVITRQRSWPRGAGLDRIPARPRVRIIGVHDIALDPGEVPTRELDRPAKPVVDRPADLHEESVEVDLTELAVQAATEEVIELDGADVVEIADPQSEIRERAPRIEPALSPLPDSWSLPELLEEDDDEPDDTPSGRLVSSVVRRPPRTAGTPRTPGPRRRLIGSAIVLLAVCAGGMGSLFWPRAPMSAEAHAEVPAGTHTRDFLRPHRAPPREAAIREVATTDAPIPQPGGPTHGRVTIALETQGAHVVLAPKRGPRRALKGPWPMTLDLDPGDYDIIAVRSGYRPRLVPLHVDRATDERVTVALFPAPFQPANADIYE